MQTLSLSEALFTGTQRKVLGLLYGKPQQSFYANEIARHAQVGKGSLMRELERLQDAHNPALSFSSRFDLAYNAAHALALTALRLQGYRSDRRYLVFQCLMHTLSVSQAQVRLFALCHERRNLAEYEGYMDVDEKLLAELLAAADALVPEV